MADIEELIERLHWLTEGHDEDFPIAVVDAQDENQDRVINVGDVRDSATALSAQQREIAELREAMTTIGGQAICYGMRADENELRDWLKFISETAEAALNKQDASNA